MMRLITCAALICGYLARISATTPDTSGAAPEVPDHSAYSPPGSPPTRSSAGAATPITMLCDEASRLAFPCRSRPATVSTPGIVAGAPDWKVPPARLPAAATITTSFCSAYRNALSQLCGHDVVELVRDMLMTLAPLSTAQRTASGICWSTPTPAGFSDPSQVDTANSSAPGATPM